MHQSEEGARIVRARIRLLIDQPWFGTLALNLKVIDDPAVAKMATDGTRLLYNPTWTAAQDDEVLVGTVAHEAMHCGLLHPFRLKGRDLALANKAMDYAINLLLIGSGLKLPEGALVDRQYEGLAWETIYARLLHDQQEKQKEKEKKKENQNDDQKNQGDDTEEDDGQGDDDGTPGDSDGGPDDLLPAPAAPAPGQTVADPAMTEVDWQIVTDQATMVAKKRGLMPADAERAFQETLQPRANWREILRRFVDQTMPSDYSWAQPNRRYIASGLYLPTVVKENAPRFVVALDTSGSISQQMLDLFSAELTAIMLEVRPLAIDVVSCDARIQNVETFTADDGVIVPHPKGGGGTAFQPVFDWLEEQDERPAALIYLTDLAGDTPTAPAVPVLWVTPEWVTAEGLFGDTVRLPS